MLAVRCVNAEIFGLTTIKTRKLRYLYATWRSMIRYPSTYRELRERYPDMHSIYARAASFKMSSPNEPLHLPKDMFRIVKANGKFTKFFLRIPIKARDYLWLPLRMDPRNEPIIGNCAYGDSKVVKRGKRFFLHLTVKREVESRQASTLLGIDLGERILATAVLWQGSQTSIPRWFYGGKREAYADITRGFGSGSENENSSKRFIESEERRKEPSMISAIRSVVKS